MWQYHPDSGEVVTLLFGNTGQTVTLVENGELLVVRVALARDQEIPKHHPLGTVTIQCLGGMAVFGTPAGSVELVPGDFLYLEASESYWLRATVDATLLITTAPSVRRLPLHARGPTTEVNLYGNEHIDRHWRTGCTSRGFDRRCSSDFAEKTT